MNLRFLFAYKKEYLAYFAIVLICYSLPVLLAKVFLSGVFLFGIFIKKDFRFLLIVFLLISNSPGYIFSYADNKYSLSNLGIGFSAERGVSFQELFFILCTLASFEKIPKFKSVYSKYYVLILFYILILFSFSLYDLSALKVLRTIRGFIPHLAYLFLPLLFPKEKDYVRLSVALLPFVFIVLFTQIIELALHKPLAELLGSQLSFDIVIDANLKTARQNYSQVLLLYILFGAGYLLNSRMNLIYNITSNALWIIILAINLSIFISATRGYMVASLFITIMLLFMNLKKIRTINFIPWLIGFVFISITIYTLPFIRTQIISAFDRIATLEEVAVNADMSAGGTSSRQMRAEDALIGYEDSPIFGFGFTEKFWKYANVHVGIPTNLVNGGIIGLAIIIGFWIVFINKSLIARSKSKKEEARKFTTFIIGLISFIIVHLSSNYIFSFVHLSQSDGRIILIALLYSFSSVVILKSHENNKRITE